jgi:hypothetical protein
VSIVTILPRLHYCSIDALDGKGPIARRVDCDASGSIETTGEVITSWLS